MAVADPIRFVLGDKKPVHGNVLYLPLEDNERRLKERIDKISQGQTRWSERLQIRTEWRRFDQGGLEDIEAWAKSVESPRLIWVDTLPKVRPVASKRSEAAYDADYRAIDGLQKLIGQHSGLGAVLNCHLRKAPSEDDPFDEVSGTLGLTAAADTIIVLKKHSGMVKLYVRGRDIEEGEFAAEFNRASCRWRIVGGAEEAFRSRERNGILAALQEAGRDQDGKPVAMSVSQLMAATERTDRNAIDQMLYKMRKTGEVEIAGRGLYSLPFLFKPGKIGKKGPSEAAPEPQFIDNSSVSETTNLTDESYRNLTGTEGGKIPVRLDDSSKPLTDNGNSPDLTDLTDLTGFESREPAADPSADDLDIPHSLRVENRHLWKRAADNQDDRTVALDRRPALGPPGDILDDFE